jgi:dUTP pyrophosphatase
VEGFKDMNKLTVKIKTLENFKGDLPQYQSTGASGVDVRAQLEGSAVTLKKGERAMIPTGLSFEIPLGFEIQARPRSGWAAKSGLTVLNTPGTIDADYRGEVKIIVINLGQEDVVINDQERCAQLVVAPVIQAQFELVNDLSTTERGAGGFGSTGRA